MTEIRTSAEISEIAKAIAGAQAEMENVAKDRENPHFRARYATLAGVLDEVRPKLARQGIAVIQMPVNGEGLNIGIVTRLLHSSGQWIESALYVAPTKFDAQGVGSVLTYLRRYSLMAIAGVGQEDDDGNAAVGRPEQRPATNGATRTVAAPPPPEKAAHLSGNGSRAPLPPHPEESGEATAARQRIPMLVSKIKQLIETAPDNHRLDVTWDGEELKAELAEIEQAPHAGTSKATGKAVPGFEAANQLRALYNQRVAELRGAAA